MKKIFSTLILISLVLPVFAQQTQPPDDGDVVRVTTSLVQIDTIVTDKAGNPVTDLTAADFEIFQDGKPQKITSLSYVNTEIPAEPAAPKKDGKTAAPPVAAAAAVPPAPPRPENAGRVITFVVDDGNCFSSRLGMRAAREALEKFVNQQMRPDDLVAIYQTRGGSSMLQQFTGDRAQLMNIIRKIRWYPPQGICANEGTGDFFDPARVESASKPSGGEAVFESESDREGRNRVENRARENQVAGLIGVLRYITRGLQRVSGRKTVFLLSDGLPLMSTEAKLKGPVNSPTATLRIGDSGDVMRDLIDLANRASVVFNTIDVRGVMPSDGEITAQDDLTGMAGRDGNINETSKILARRRAAIMNSQSGLFYLAEETGGSFYRDANDLSVPVRRALNLERGYYLIGYQPDEDTFKGKKFNQIEVKVRRADLNVRTRSGFFGVTDESRLPPKKRGGDGELYEAIVAPLPVSGLDLRMTAFFGSTPTTGGFVRSLLHLDGRGITFADDGKGMQSAVFDVVAVTLDEKNKVVDDFNRTYTLRLPAENLAAVRQNGLTFTTDVPVKKAGVYNFRIALRDASSKRIGSASQPIEVPDLKKTNVFVSGLSVSRPDANGKFVFVSAAKLESGFSAVASMAMPEVRQFRRGDILAYSYSVYGARADKATAKPKLTSQVLLYREGEVVLKGEPQPVQIEAPDAAAAGAPAARVDDYGYLRLKPDILTGDYALQVVVRDTLTGKVSAQWIDFRIAD